MPAPQFDPIAEKLASSYLPSPVVTFSGYVGPGTAGTDTFRVYLDPWFIEWLEIDNDDLQHQLLPADARVDDKSVVWVRAGARVVRCETGTAQLFGDEHVRTADDPTLARGKKPPP